MKPKIKLRKSEQIVQPPTVYETSDLNLLHVSFESLRELIQQIQWILDRHEIDVIIGMKCILDREINPDGDLAHARISVGRKTYTDAASKGKAVTEFTIPNVIRCPIGLRKVS